MAESTNGQRTQCEERERSSLDATSCLYTEGAARGVALHGGRSLQEITDYLD